MKNNIFVRTQKFIYGKFSHPGRSFTNLKIRTRILGLFLIIISISILIVASLTYFIGKNAVENMVNNQLNNSVRSVIDQINLLSGAYTSKEFSGKLSYVLTGEQNSFNTAGLTADIYLINSSGMEVNRSDVNSDTGKKTNLPDSFIQQALKSKKGIVQLKINGDLKSVSYGYIIEKDWIYAVAVSKSSYMKFISQLQTVTILSGIITLVLSFLLSFAGTSGIINSVKEISKTVSKADSGNLTVRAKIRHGGPEMIELAEKFNEMLSNFELLIMELGNSMEELAVSSEELIGIAGKSDESTVYIHTLTQEMADRSSEHAEFSAHAKESSDKIISTIKNIILQIDNTQKVSNTMLDTAYEGLNAIKSLSIKIAEIEEVSDASLNRIKVLESRSNQINKIANTIKGISDQTKLLSFNASIEAARAGELGRGFAVVAHEIQQLAKNSAASAFEVGEIIKEIETDTEAVLHTANQCKEISHEGSQIAGRTNMAFNMIMDKIKETHRHINHISENASSISSDILVFVDNTEKISAIITNSDKLSQEVAVTVDGHKDLSSGITASANNLVEMANKLNEYKDRFITS